LGYLNIPDELIVPLDQALQMQDHKVALMCTGSQGEPSSIVGRLSAGTNRQFDLKPNDTVVLSSHPNPRKRRDHQQDDQPSAAARCKCDL
jgi:ribonuclease J